MGRSPLAIYCTARYKRDNANVLHVGSCERAWRPTEYFMAHVRPLAHPVRCGSRRFYNLVDAELINEPRYPTIGCVTRRLGYQRILTITFRWHYV